MRKILVFFVGLFLCIDVVNAAGRGQNINPRNDAKNVSVRQTTNTRSTNSNRATTARTSINTNTRKNEKSKQILSRTPQTRKSVSARSANTTTSSGNIKVSRVASNQTKTFGTNYNSCRDSYFTCMDQFCAAQNETYRRCVCSSRLTEIKNKEAKISQTGDNLKDFQNLNLEVINKTAGEVKAMVSASEGESAMKKDKSASAKTLNSISDVLNNTKKQALSTQGQLDIAGDIKAIWSTTDLIGGADIANLTGEALYNAVHAQCAELVAQNCETSDLNMVASAYGMYIENDCSTLANNLDKKKTEANAAIRSTRHQMQDARLENYDAHNSLSINDCVARVRQDLTTETACGADYIHCLDMTGKYINSTTGKPIYSTEFYQIENQISLSGDVLTNNKNANFIVALNQKRAFAEKTLDLCRDNADEVWDEYMRQAIIEIYQKQQERVRIVKSECLRVVNDCYLDKSNQLKSFSDTTNEITLGQTLETAEDMCADKLNTCSNLYGGGSEGFAKLVDTMSEITDVTIAQTCPDLLNKYVQSICSVSVNDSIHTYPYGCRTYAPGEARYANTEICNTTLTNPFSKSDIFVSTNISVYDDYYVCKNTTKRYIRCEFNYYLYDDQGECNETNNFCFSKNNATECRICPSGHLCTGGTSEPKGINSDIYSSCGVYYIGSLYQQLVRYALQNCVRPSRSSYILPENILADVDTVMKQVQSSLVSELSKECERYNGKWYDLPWIDDDMDGYHDENDDTLNEEFYDQTRTNKLWGYCK